MRYKANKMGYSLNQRGLLEGVVRDPQDPRNKINDGTSEITRGLSLTQPVTSGNLVASETEEEIFKILGNAQFFCLLFSDGN